MGLTTKQAAAIVLPIYAATNRPEPTQTQLETWYHAIKNLDWDVAAKAAKEVIATEERTPSIATFLSYVERQFSGIAPTAEQAITEVLQKIALVGSYQMPAWSHQSIGQAVDSIGWRDICASENDYWKTQFMRAYTNVVKGVVTADRLKITSGRAALDTSSLFAIGAGE